GDVYNNGKFAIYISNITEPAILVQGNNLWVPQRGEAGQAPRYINQARGLGVELGGWSWSAQFGDLNNDGYQDLYLTNGYISADPFNRGVLDVVVANQNGPLLVYKNAVARGRQWVQLELEGKKSNRSAIGALVRVFWSNKGAARVQEQVQVVSGGNAYASQNMR